MKSLSGRKILFCVPILLLVLGCFAALGFGDTQPCSPLDKTNTDNTLTEGGKVPNVGAESGWIILYEDSAHTDISDELKCGGGSVLFFASDADNDPNFTLTPDCTFGQGCIKITESATGTTPVAATNVIDSQNYINIFRLQSDAPANPEEPEPGTLLLLGSGLCVFGALGLRRRRLPG